MILTGEKNGLSAVSKTVGYTVAIAAKNVLNGKIKTKGVIGPFMKDVYSSVGDELQKVGLFCKEYKTRLLPKL
jgi:saccharopine dehydrogenase-like NADP-dependent oxidoreductase